MPPVCRLPADPVPPSCRLFAGFCRILPDFAGVCLPLLAFACFCFGLLAVCFFGACRLLAMRKSRPAGTPGGTSRSHRRGDSGGQRREPSAASGGQHCGPVDHSPDVPSVKAGSFGGCSRLFAFVRFCWPSVGRLLASARRAECQGREPSGTPGGISRSHRRRVRSGSPAALWITRRKSGREPSAASSGQPCGDSCSQPQTGRGASVRGGV